MHARSLAPLFTLAPAAMGSLGCAGAVAAPGDADADVGTSTTAVVVVERTTSDVDGPRAEASARFVRVSARSSADEAMRAIGAALDLPPVGTCARIASLAAVRATAFESPPAVELVDVGGVSVETDGVDTRLVPRLLPDVTDVVHGFVYARAADPALLPARARYVVHVAGGRDFDAFDVAAWAPGDPDDVAVAVGAGSIDLAWRGEASDDVLYVDAQPDGVRCAFADSFTDSRAASIPSSALAAPAGSLVVHRLHREPLSARGVDSGEIRFDFARSVPYARPPSP